MFKNIIVIIAKVIELNAVLKFELRAMTIVNSFTSF